MEIIIENLLKCYGSKEAVNIEEYRIAEGTLLGLVGNNGAGKTTLFRLLLDLLKADRGRVTLGGTNPAESEEWKQQTGAYVDDGFLIDYLTPEEYFHFVGKMCGLSEAVTDERIALYADFMNGEVMGQQKFIRNLSAGNKQKVGIVAALLNEPKLVVLDEPFNFLDPTSQSVIKHVLKEYNARTGATILVSSHNLNHTVDICPRIALLEQGRLLRDIDNSNKQAEQELESYFEVKE